MFFYVLNMLILGVEPRITAYKTIVITVSLYELTGFIPKEKIIINIELHYKYKTYLDIT